LNKEVKTFVIDTNIFIHRPDAFLSFRDNEIVIPLWVLEELDRLKSYSDERGRNARQAVRLLHDISRQGSLSEGVRLDNGSTLKVAVNRTHDVPLELDREKTDNKILLTAYALQQEGRKVFFVTKDINARVKATALGIKTVDYEKQKVDINQLYTGSVEIDASREMLQTLRTGGSIPWNERMIPNQFVSLKEKKDGATALSRYNAQTGSLDLVDPHMGPVSGITPLNERQLMAFNLLLDRAVSLVTLVGKAGTGKTLLAIAAGLKKVLVDKEYSRVLVTRPVIPMGKDIGYLPGVKSEKLSPWMQPLFDNLEYILSVYSKQNAKSIDQLIDSQLIELEALTYLRGRSLPGQYIIIDEAQNLSPHEIKTIVSRAGTGTKVVLTGDPYQIDSPYLDSNSNGLIYLVEAFKGRRLFGHVTLLKSERSELAELAAELL
jgi:PhoH-like ATPase